MWHYANGFEASRPHDALACYRRLTARLLRRGLFAAESTNYAPQEAPLSKSRGGSPARSSQASRCGSLVPGITSAMQKYAGLPLTSSQAEPFCTSRPSQIDRHARRVVHACSRCRGLSLHVTSRTMR